MASILGANIYSDIFFVAFKIPNLFRRIFAEGAFIQSFIPAFSRSKEKNLFAITIFIHFFLIIFILSLLFTLFAPFFTKIIAFGFDDELVKLAAPYVAINFYYLDFIFCVTFLAALLQYKEHFATTAFSTALLNLALISSLLLAKDLDKENILFYLSIGVLVGGFLQLLIHLFMANRFGIIKRLLTALCFFKQKRVKIKNELKIFYKNFFPAILGNSTAQISAFLDTWLASFLASGAISYLYYSNRVFQLPLALFAIATATALFPTISKAIKQKNEKEAFKNIKKSFWILTTLLTLSFIGGFLLSEEIVKILFQRGSFSYKDTLNTAFVLKMYMIGLLPYGLSKLFSLWIYAEQKQLIAAKIASYSLLANIILSIALIFLLNEAGLALASSISGFILFYLTIKEFGLQKFLSLLKDRFAIYLLLLTVFEIVIILTLKAAI
jgi:putative peptidoglycan lipid II flippase